MVTIRPMIKIGITGQSGFIGSHLFNLIGTKAHFERIPFEDEFFQREEELNTFVRKCDIIVHFAAVNRSENQEELYSINVNLVKKLIGALKKTKSTPQIIFSSSIQEEIDNPYGRSKLEGGRLFSEWATAVNARFTNLVIPNVFGPFGKPYYNSFIATFCHQLNNEEQPKVISDSIVQLKYVGNLCEVIINCIHEQKEEIEKIFVEPDFEMKVSEILELFQGYKKEYLEAGIIPTLQNKDETNLFNTFVSFIARETAFPKKYVKHTDTRGDFVELLKLNSGGQVSFSTTKPGVVRGNHYHTRKIERFSVIKGEALIELRKIGTKEKISYRLDGEAPAYVDIPIWYTHNIKNIGEGDLYTFFFINEFYNKEDPDTFFEEV